MTEAEKNERIKAVEEEMAKLQEELEDIRNAKLQDWDFSAWYDIPLKRYKFNIPAYSFAIMLFKENLDKFTKLMKFKCCYDYSYAPDWTNESELKWYVFFHTPTRKYEVNWAVTWGCPTIVYFSCEEIAQKCADWFNAGCPEE